jgi:hypothetical protein
MAVTRAYSAGREQCFQQIERLTNSHSLRGSESLCRLLRYLAEHSLDHPGVALKEYQIATEVLGRPAGFDPQSDSTVRVQAGRLRLKLHEYYAHEGADDPIIVEVPKGSYSLSFHLRSVPDLVPHALVMDQQPGPARAARLPGKWGMVVVALAVLFAASLLTSAILLSRPRTQASNREAIPQVYQVFWSRFANAAQPPWVIFSNGNFVGRPETGMRYFNPTSDSRALILDHYTGVGEVLAVHQLDRVFQLFDRPLRVKRGSLFSLDDAKNNDLIFIGSPAENLTLLEIPGTKEFIFQRVESGARKGDLGVLNVHPQPGEPPIFMASRSGEPTIEDYAVIGLVPGLDPARPMLILAGTTTIGTQAAAEYVCRPDDLADLLQRLGVSRAADLKPFEALLRVKITRGVPVKEDLIAVRKPNP